MKRVGWEGARGATYRTAVQTESEYLPRDGNVIEILQYCNCNEASITVR